MKDLAIKVENVSKLYRLGKREVGKTTLAQVAYSALSSSIRNLRRLYKLTHFEENESTADILWALRDINLEIKQGEIIGIIGGNGAGKSTLLKILSRITDPSQGKIELHGRVASLLEVGTGFHPELTGRENIYLNGTLLGMTKSEINRKFDQIVDFSEIENFLDTPVKRYSSGMYVRLAFAVAAHLEPEILLVDEVLAVGDLNFQKKCLGKMHDVSYEEGRTIIFVSHNLGAIASLTTKCLYLKEGKLIDFSNTTDVLNRYLSESYTLTSHWKTEQKTDYPLQIIAVKLFDIRGRATTTPQASEGFILEVEYEVRQNLRDSVVELWLYTAGGNHLVTLGDHDANVENRILRKKGYYRSQIHFPGNILNVGTYYVRVNSSNSLQTFDYNEAFSFRLEENQSFSPRTNRQGMILPMLPWKIIEYSPLP